MQTRTLRRNGARTAIIAALVLLTAGVLFLTWHSGNLARAWNALRDYLDGRPPAAVHELPLQKPVVSDEAAWRDWAEKNGKALSSGISQVIKKHPAAKAAVSSALAAADTAVGGLHFAGSYSFHQAVRVIPGSGDWSGGGGGGCVGEGCDHPDCHLTNSCPPPDCQQTNNCPPPDCQKTNTCPPPDCHDTNNCPPPDCHQTNSCPPDCHQTNNCPPPDCHQTNTCPPDCHQTNTCPPDCHDAGNCNPHPVDESISLSLVGSGLLTLLYMRRGKRSSRRAKAPAPPTAGCDGDQGSR